MAKSKARNKLSWAREKRLVQDANAGVVPKAHLAKKYGVSREFVYRKIRKWAAYWKKYRREPPEGEMPRENAVFNEAGKAVLLGLVMDNPLEGDRYYAAALTKKGIRVTHGGVHKFLRTQNLSLHGERFLYATKQWVDWAGDPRLRKAFFDIADKSKAGDFNPFIWAAKSQCHRVVALLFLTAQFPYLRIGPNPLHATSKKNFQRMIFKTGEEDLTSMIFEVADNLRKAGSQKFLHFVKTEVPLLVETAHGKQVNQKETAKVRLKYGSPTDPDARSRSQFPLGKLKIRSVLHSNS